MMQDATPNSIPRLHRVPVLLLTSVLAVALLAFRVMTTNTHYFLFLGWNLFLAWLPWLFAQIATIKKLPDPLRIPVLGAWLLFFPNAPYLLTDLFHLRARSSMPIWFDLLLILTFAWAGLMWGFVSLRQIEQQVLRRWFGRLTPMVTAGLLLLSAYGVYLGRYLRFNSWELATHPERILQEVLGFFIHPLADKPALGFTLGFGVFLIMAYALYVGSDGKMAFKQPRTV